MFGGIKKAIGRLLHEAGWHESGNVVGADLGPGITASAGGYYGYPSGGDGSAWQYGLSGATSIDLDHTRLRENARIAYHDSPPARAIIERYADLVVGVGLRLEALPKYQMLGISAEEAEQWGSDVTEAFDAYMGSKSFSLMQDETGYQSQRLVSIMQWRDGEYFSRLHYSADRSLLNPLQVSFIDPSQINGDGYTFTDGIPYADSGIVYDKNGRETGYKVTSYNYDTKQFDTVTVPKYGGRSKRLMMLHGYQKEYPGQTRGYSRLAHALQAFDSFASFEHAHIHKAINDAAVTMYVKPSADRPATNPLEDYAAAAVGPYQAPNDPGTTVDSTGSVNYSEMNTVNLRPDSIGVFNLQGGEDLKSFNGSAPVDQYDSFTNAFVRSLAASMSMPVEVLWMQFNENYSASRAALVLLWQVIAIWRSELISDYLEPIFEMWLSGEIAAGRVKAPGWTDPRLRRAWMAGHWVGFPMPSIDPLKEAKAKEQLINLGATTLDRVAQENNGSSGKANRAKLAREFAELPRSPFLPPLPTENNEGMSSEDASNKKGPGRPQGS